MCWKRLSARQRSAKEDCVLEIGPGIGTMTQYLACAAGRVIAVEIDRALIPILEDTLDGYENVKIINEDVLRLDLAALARGGERRETAESRGKSALLYYHAHYHGTV